MKKSFIYTCTGDGGTTALVGGARLPKDDVRIEAYGTVDELNSQIGLLLAETTLADGEKATLHFVQNKLFNIGSYLATDSKETGEVPVAGLDADDVGRLEAEIDRMDAELPPLRNFVLPGGTVVSSLAHVCRTVARRAERRIVSLSHEAYVDPLVLRFVNRLSDYFFVFARFNNVASQVDEIFWDKNC